MPYFHTCPVCGRVVGTVIRPYVVECTRCGRVMKTEEVSDDKYRARFGPTKRQKYVPAWIRKDYYRKEE